MPVNLLEVEQHVISDVAARNKGCLDYVQDVVGCTAHARGEDARDGLVVAVEEGR